ncbi:MAG: YqeG family HAD IIIA-type phosphatase [Ruminococcaceae bacterium]|nr:YqeG family HAD IIIA-type phosphatase [Oscillospiraceae bacterium]
MLSLLPKYVFSKLTDIEPKFFKSLKIDLVFLDFDNTMLPYTSNEPTKELLSWLDSMKTAGLTLCIVSNSHKQRVPDFAEKYGVFCVTGAKKPRTKGICEAMKRFERTKAQTVLIGDQIYTDVLGANLAGITSVIVKSIHNHNFWLKLRHVFEVPFLAMAKNRRVKR